MSSIFTKIIRGDIPSYKVAEDEFHYAFLDIGPISRGHTLVVPKQEVDYIHDLDEESYLSLYQFARRVAKSMDEVFDCDRIGVMVMGLEVPHAHIHLIPISKASDMDFTRPKLSLSSEEMNTIASSIASQFNK